MEKISFFAIGAIVSAAVSYFFVRSNRNIPFNRAKALVNLRPFDTLMKYAEEFQTKRDNAEGQVCFDKDTVPNYITYNRDAFIAIINAPRAEKIRIYFGLGSSAEVQASGRVSSGKQDLLLCIFPVDGNDKVIEAELVKDDRYGGGSSIKSVYPLMLTFAAPAKAQGVDDGQRQP